MIIVAILKHVAGKSADYGAALDYLKYEHDEVLKKPLLDANGNWVLRRDILLEGINCEPELFDVECEMLNAQYHKNQNYDEIKTHHYLISFDPADKDECGLTGEQAQAIGMEYVKANFPGHQALVCTHMDGHNSSGNIHVHIVINSLRKLDVPQQPFMERPIDCKAGYKHHLTKDYLKHLQQSLMNICMRENLNQVDLLSPSVNKITQQEYYAKQRGQINLDKLNAELIADGFTPMKTKFQTEKDKLRDAITAAAKKAKSFEEFCRLLQTESNILVKDHRGRFNYLLPDREKYISARTLGTSFDREHLLTLFESNAITAAKEKQQWSVADPIAVLYINKRTIIGWERDGRYPRSIEMLEKMADIFHVPLTYLQPDQSLFIERAAEAYGKKGKIEAQHLAFELTELFASGELTPQDMDGIMYEMHKAYFKYREQKREKERIMNL